MDVRTARPPAVPAEVADAARRRAQAAQLELEQGQAEEPVAEPDLPSPAVTQALGEPATP
eukprot:1713644-Alexandrium_andersonii.AAC.1